MVSKQDSLNSIVCIKHSIHRAIELLPSSPVITVPAETAAIVDVLIVDGLCESFGEKAKKREQETFDQTAIKQISGKPAKATRRETKTNF